MSSKRVIINEDGSVELPKSTDGPRCLELVWDGQVVTTPEDKIPSSFINRCQDTLKLYSPVINVISTEAVEGIEGSGFPLSVPSIFNPYVARISQILGDDIGGLGSQRGTIISAGTKLELFLKEPDMNWGKSSDYEDKLIKKTAGRAIAGPLLEEFAAKLNNSVTNTIMDYVYSITDSSLDEIIRKNSRGEYIWSRWINVPTNRIRSYGIGTKVMLHPQALDFIPAKKNVGSWTWENSLKNIPLCLNWDMPEPSDSVIEVLVGDFSQFMMVLKPIKLTLEYSENRWKLKAETQALCGIWSSVSLGFTKAKIELKDK